MHEYPLVKTIINKAEAHAKQHNALAVKSITLVVGDYSGYVGDSIQMYFDLIAEDTLCRGANLVIKRVQPKLKCSGCGCLFERRPFSFECPACGAEGGPTDIGKELYIEDIEIIRNKENL